MSYKPKKQTDKEKWGKVLGDFKSLTQQFREIKLQNELLLKEVRAVKPSKRSPVEKAKVKILSDRQYAYKQIERGLESIIHGLTLLDSTA